MLRIILLVLFVSVICATDNCDQLGILVYEDIGCTPVHKNGVECPVKYDCSSFDFTNETCIFRSRSLATGQSVDNDEIYSSCHVACTCMGVGYFNCAVLDCPEWLGSPVKENCYRKYDVDKCCSVGQNCPSDSEKFGECEVDGKKYREGEKMFPKDTCLKCVCPSQFNGKLEEPHCKRHQCAVQIRNGQNLRDNCAPFYTNSKVLCCPDSWICPSADDKIITVNEDVDKNSDLICEFGSKTLKLGEGLEREVDHYGTKKNAKCECIIPPLLTCKEI